MCYCMCLWERISLVLLHVLVGKNFHTGVSGGDSYWMCVWEILSHTHIELLCVSWDVCVGENFRIESLPGKPAMRETCDVHPCVWVGGRQREKERVREENSCANDLIQKRLRCVCDWVCGREKKRESTREDGR